MSASRVLVVRSGANPFASFAVNARVEIVEHVSHTIVAVEPDRGALEAPADWAIFTSQVAVERVFGDRELAPRFREGAAEARLVAVGAATGEALASRGAAADLIAGGIGPVIEVFDRKAMIGAAMAAGKEALDHLAGD